MNLDREENSRFPKAFIVCPNVALLPPEDCLPTLYKQGLDTYYINQKIGLNQKDYIEELYTNITVAYDLFPRSIFLLNAHSPKVEDSYWVRFLQIIKNLPKKGDHAIRTGIYHESALINESNFRQISSENLLIRIGANRRENINNLSIGLRQSLTDRRKFPRFNCFLNGVQIMVTFKIKNSIYCARIFDISSGHFSCIFAGSPPEIQEYEKIEELTLTVNRDNLSLPSVYHFTRDFYNPKYKKNETLYVFCFSGQDLPDSRAIDKIDDFVFRSFQKFTHEAIEEKQIEITEMKNMALTDQKKNAVLLEV